MTLRTDLAGFLLAGRDPTLHSSPTLGVIMWYVSETFSPFTETFLPGSIICGRRHHQERGSKRVDRFACPFHDLLCVAPITLDQDTETLWFNVSKANSHGAIKLVDFPTTTPLLNGTHARINVPTPLDCSRSSDLECRYTHSQNL